MKYLMSAERSYIAYVPSNFCEGTYQREMVGLTAVDIVIAAAEFPQYE